MSNMLKKRTILQNKKVITLSLQFSHFMQMKHKEVLFISTWDIKPTLKSTIWYVEMISSYLAEKETLFNRSALWIL